MKIGDGDGPSYTGRGEPLDRKDAMYNLPRSLFDQLLSRIVAKGPVPKLKL